MPGTNTSAIPITVFRVLGASDSLPTQMRMAEVSSLTVNYGTPVRIVSGYVAEMDTIDGTDDLILGFTSEGSHTLGTSGTAPQGGSGTTYGSVPNQASAKNIPIGAPMADGTLGVFLAQDDTIFVGVTDAAHTTIITDIGSTFGLTKDSTTSNWFVDTTITSTASGACVLCTDIVDPIGTGNAGVGAAGGRIAFRVLGAYQQYFQ